jgi:hypothetical protein
MDVTLTSKTALREAADAGHTGKTSQRWCEELCTNSQGEQCTWGFRIYRTVYTPGSDDGKQQRLSDREGRKHRNYGLTGPSDFAAGLRIISAHLRKSCFRDADKGGDDTPNQQLWQRMKNTIIDDRATFEGAPPSVIQQHFQAWIEQQGYHLPNIDSQDRDPPLEMASSASHRLCVIIDGDALTNVLRFAPSRVPAVRYNDYIGVKVLDVECHADSEEYDELPFDEGWLWAPPIYLARIWFEYAELAADEMRTTDSLGRPVFIEM